MGSTLGPIECGDDKGANKRKSSQQKGRLGAQSYFVDGKGINTVWEDGW